MNTSSIKISGLGRRKTSTALVEFLPNANLNTAAEFTVNGRAVDSYFQLNSFYLNEIYAPLKKLNLINDYQISVRVKGGGLTAQAQAIQLGIARALSALDQQNFRAPLKVEGFLRRDARIKERRKYGLKKARKASQSSKR